MWEGLVAMITAKLRPHINGAARVAADTARSGKHSGNITLRWQVNDLSAIGQGTDKVSLLVGGDFAYANTASAISGDVTVK